MRKPIKIYLFFLVLITAFGLLGNVLIQDEPNLDATDINTNIPGSETMLALYEPLAELLGEDAIYDVAVLPNEKRYDAELLLMTTKTEEQALQQDTISVLQAIQHIELHDVTVTWQTANDTIMSASFTAPFNGVVADTIATNATSYSYTP